MEDSVSLCYTNCIRSLVDAAESASYKSCEYCVEEFLENLIGIQSVQDPGEITAQRLMTMSRAREVFGHIHRVGQEPSDPKANRLVTC